MRHRAPEHPLLWMLVWRDTCEEQLGAGGILAVRTGPMGVPLCRPSPGISAGRCYGTPPTPAAGKPAAEHERRPQEVPLSDATGRRAGRRRGDPSGGDAFDGGCVADAAFHWSWRVNARMSLTSRSGAWREAKCPPRSYSVQRTMSCERSARVRIEVSPGNTATAVGTPDGLPPDALHRPAHTCPASTRRKQAHPAAGHPRRDGCRLESLKPPSTAAANYRSDSPQSMADPAPQRRLALLYRTCSLRIWPKSG